MIVKTDFFCIQDKKTYKKGDIYTGVRKDLGHLMAKEPQTEEAKVVKRKKRK